MNMKIGTWNIQGKPKKNVKIFRKLKDMDTDLIFLSETENKSVKRTINNNWENMEGIYSRNKQ